MVRMYLKNHILICGLFFIFFNSGAQNCGLTLKGVIEDQENSETLGFAVVRLLSPEKAIQTNDKGEFRFDSLCAGEYQVLVQHFGCKDTVFNISLSKNRKVLLKLPHSLNNLEEVDIMDKRSEMKKTQAVEHLSEEEIQKTKGQNLGEVLKNISGVTSLNTGGTISKPMVHGMQGYRLLILNNGIRQEGQQWGNEHAPEIDPFMAKRFSVIKGVSAIRYGSDAIAGVIVVEPDALPDTAAVTGEVDVVGLSNGQTGAVSAKLEGYLDKMKGFNWRVQGTLKKGGNIQTPDYYLSNTGIEERNFSYALGYHRKKFGAEIYYSQFNTTIGIFKGSHIGNLTDLNNALKLNKPVDSLASFTYAIDRPKQVAEHELINATAHYHLSSKWRTKFQYAWQYNIRQEYDLRRLTAVEREGGVISPDLDLRLNTQTAELLVEHDNIRSFRGMYGLSYVNQKNVYTGRFFIPNFLSNSYGIFATERFVKRYFEVELGARYDEKYLESYFYKGKIWTQHLRNFRNYTYNGGVIWKPTSDFNLFINSGSAWRAPSPNELYSDGVHQGVGTIERGNSEFKSETCFNVSSSAIYKSKKLHLELTGYYNLFKNFVYLNPSGELELTIRGAFPVFNYMQDNVRISGFDLKAEYPVSKNFVLLTKGMIVRAWNLSLNDYLIFMPSDRFDLNCKLKLPVTKYFHESYFQINNQLVAKQWRTPKNVDFTDAPPAYYLLGAELSSGFQIKKQKILIHLSATNLLNARYREYLDRFRYFSDAAGVSYNLRLTIPLTIYNKK